MRSDLLERVQYLISCPRGLNYAFETEAEAKAKKLGMKFGFRLEAKVRL